MKNPLSIGLWLCILLSVICLQMLYWHWPRSVCLDATFSLFAAQNAVDHGHFESLEPETPFDSDLGKIKLQWLNGWPPMVSLGFAALMKEGLSPGAATDLMVLVLVLGGTLGWVLLFQRAGVNGVALHVLALAIPWTTFPAYAWVCFFNDHLAWSLAPWGVLLLLDLPDTKAVAPRDFWWRLPLTALVCGLTVFAKYSAFPLVMGAGIYFLARDGWFCNGRKIMHSLWFGAFLVLPGLTVYLLNHALSGMATAQVRTSPAFFAVGGRQFYNLLVPPLSILSGWHQIDKHTGTGIWKHWFCMGMAGLIWPGIGLAFLLRRQALINSRMLKLLLIMTAATWTFLMVLTTIFGHITDWTNEARYGFPVIFAWYCIAIILVFDRHTPLIPKAGLAVVCGIPLVVNLTTVAVRPLLRTAPEPQPESRLAAAPAENAVYRFLESRLANGEAHPNLIISTWTSPMNELKVPTLPWFIIQNLSDLHSSKPLIVWTLLDNGTTRVLIRHLDKSVIIRQIPMAKDSPWEFLVLNFK